MGNLTFTGSEELNAAFSRVQNIPFSVVEEALVAMADVAVQEIRDTGEAMGVRDENSPVHVLDHLVTKKARKTDDGGKKTITFSGTRRRGNTETREAEIAFVNEYGKRGQAARPFIRTAMTQNQELISAPGVKIVGDWVEENFKK